MILAVSEDLETYCSGDVKDGVLRILFRPYYLGTNIYSAFSDFQSIINNAPRPAGASKIPFSVRYSMKKDSGSQLESLQAEIAKQMAGRNIIFEPDFEGVALTLLASNEVVEGWQRNFGSFMTR